MDKVLVTAPHHYRVQQVILYQETKHHQGTTKHHQGTTRGSGLKTLWVRARTRNSPSPCLATPQLHLLYGCKAKLYLGLETMPEGISE